MVLLSKSVFNFKQAQYEFALTAIGIALFICGIFIYLSVAPKLGGKNTDEKLLKLQNSPNFKDGKFHNLVATPMVVPKFSTVLKFFSIGKVGC